jgi:lipopolysaccharide export system protein LptA
MTNITRLAAIAATGAAFLALPGVGGAQSFQSGQPIMWGADRVEYQGTGVTLIGRAELTQGDSRLRADRITGLDQSGDSQRVEATGDVYLVTPEQTIRGDRAVYTTENDTIVLTGDVILTQGENVITGARLVYNTRTEAAQMDGGSGGRVQGVFYPNRGN